MYILKFLNVYYMSLIHTDKFFPGGSFVSLLTQFALPCVGLLEFHVFSSSLSVPDPAETTARKTLCITGVPAGENREHS